MCTLVHSGAQLRSRTGEGGKGGRPLPRADWGMKGENVGQTLILVPDPAEGPG